MKQLAIFLRALVIVGAVEVLVMFILPLFGLQEGIVKNLLDAVLLTTVCAPLFYVWVVGPTAHNLSEPRLRESEELSRLLLDSAAEAIYGVDLDGNCTFCNPASLRLLGYERPEDLLGKNIHRLMHHTRPDGTPYL